MKIGLRKPFSLRTIGNKVLLIFIPATQDRDAARWNLDEAETARRRQLFWELYTYDTWQVSLHVTD
jgi:hypothetical protein